MAVTHDMIASVSGPGWKYALSRILLDDNGRGVVFIAGSEEPFAEFEQDEVLVRRGTGVTPEGQISWRRRGSSCQYKLAKCKVTTETLESWWAGGTADGVDGQLAAVTEEGELVAEALLESGDK